MPRTVDLGAIREAWAEFRLVDARLESTLTAWANGSADREACLLAMLEHQRCYEQHNRLLLEAIGTLGSGLPHRSDRGRRRSRSGTASGPRR